MASSRSTRVRHSAEKADGAHSALSAELDSARAEIERRQRVADVVLETMDVGIVLCDADGGTWVRNRAERALMGLDMSTAGTPPEATAAHADVLDAHGRPVAIAEYPLLRALRAEDVGAVELLLGPAGGPHREVVAHTARIVSAEGLVLGAVSALTDVSAERSSMRALADEHQLLVEAQKQALGVNDFFDAVLTATPDDMYVLDLASEELVYSSPGHRAVAESLGHEDGFAVTILGDLVLEEDAALLSSATEQAAGLLDGAVVELRYRIISKGEGVWGWLSHRLTPFRRDDHGTVVEALAIVRDISAWVEAEESMLEADRVRLLAESRFQTGFDQAGIGAAIIGLDGVPTHVNAAACALLGRPVEMLVGRPWSEFEHPDNSAMETEMVARLSAGDDTLNGECRFLRPDGSVVWASAHVTVVRDAEGEPHYVLAQLADIKDRKRMEEELEHLALQDSLTGVHTVIERNGYAVGDLVLTQVARRLSDCLGHDATIANLQPCQFAILVKGSTHDAVHAAELALATMERPFDLLDGTITLQASAGISAATSYAGVGTSLVGRLVQDAAGAAAHARADGTDDIAFASAEMREEQERQHQPQALVRDALDHDLVKVAYQPVLDLPGDLIPVLEESGLIVEVGLRVLKLAAEQAAGWHADHGVWIPVAVNVSAVQLERADFLDNVLCTVARAHVPPEALSIELTESVLVKAGSTGVEKLRELQDAGISLAIDDFGTGYASLSYLQELPASTLKVDRSFVEGIPHDSGAMAIVDAVIGLARTFGMTCIAEGIEDEAQLAYLSEQKVHGQGYLLGGPGDAAAIGRMLADATHPLGSAGSLTRYRR